MTQSKYPGKLENCAPKQICPEINYYLWVVCESFRDVYVNFGRSYKIEVDLENQFSQCIENCLGEEFNKILPYLLRL